jgi:hypothetical protein
MSRPPPASGDRARSGSGPSPLNPTAVRAQDVRAERNGSKVCVLPAGKPPMRHALSSRSENPLSFALEAVGGELDRGP